MNILAPREIAEQQTAAVRHISLATQVCKHHVRLHKSLQNEHSYQHVTINELTHQKQGMEWSKTSETHPIVVGDKQVSVDHFMLQGESTPKLYHHCQLEIKFLLLETSTRTRSAGENTNKNRSSQDYACLTQYERSSETGWKKQEQMKHLVRRLLIHFHSFPNLREFSLRLTNISSSVH